VALGAIDIGSNAVRLLIAEPYKEGDAFKKVKLFRLPVRLGLDSFTEGFIQEETQTKLVKALKAFKLLMEVFDVEDYRAFATSALREASNGNKVIEIVKKKAKVNIELIDGKEEARIILNNKASRFIDERFKYLYVDVGGGSTEISLLYQDRMVVSESFRIGTIRLLKKQVKDPEWKRMGKWLSENILEANPLAILGSGGNINRIFKRSQKKAGDALEYDEILREHRLLYSMSIEERIRLEDLNRDRAEVIVPALDIFLFVMDRTKVSKVIVPKIGLSDGIIWDMMTSSKKS